jgi:hypothetical protein
VIVDRISKLAILGWALVAFLVECYYISGAWHRALVIGPAIFAGAALAAYIDRRAVAPVAAAAYLFPILIFTFTGLYHVHFSVVWLGGVLGVVTPDGLRTGWHVPQRWRAPLVCWAGGVLATTPIIALRAVDFQPELLFRTRLETEALGGFPLLTITWIIHVALLLAIGILWFDWLCARDVRFFERWVAIPLASSAALLGAAACYQLFLNVSYLNPTVYAALGRASGTVLDANVAGAIAACWIGGWAILASRRPGPWRLIGTGLIAVLWLAVWATGSRTALASALITSLVTAAGFVRGRWSMRTVAAGAALVLVVAAVAYAGLSSSNNHIVGPLIRIQGMVPDRSVAGFRAAATELWNRNDYGVAATRMINAYPAFGVGVGAFHEMASEFAGHPLPPDNAQNWYRHQIVELGIVGSLGWIVFVGSFGWWVVRRQETGQLPASPLRGAILGLAIVSLLGMPGQDPAMALTFWTFSAWYLLVSGRPADPRPTTRAAWMAATVIVLVFVAGTAQSAMGRLRIPVRIQRLGGDYLYGFSWAEPDGEGGFYRWARRKATAVVPAPTQSLELTLRVNHLDLAEHPTRAKAWVDGKLVWDGTLTAGADTIKKAVLLPGGERRALIETWADHAVSAPAGDGRELALMVRWRFLPSSR